jgi:hypothetical protein
MVNEEDTYSTLFSVLKHPIRRRIIRMLYNKPHAYMEILSVLNVETGFLNYHLDSMRELVKKDERRRYSLSIFGEAAVGLISRVEEPTKRESKAIRIMGFRLNLPRILTLAIVALLISNVCSFSSYQSLYRERTNALGEVMIQTRGLLSEANRILNQTLVSGIVNFDAWQVMLRDMALQLRLYAIISELDPDHRQQWMQIRLAVDDVTTLFFQIDQKYETVCERCLNLTKKQISSLSALLEGLAIIEAKAFPRKMVIGTNPEIRVDEEELTESIKASFDIQARVQTAQVEFGLQGK